MKLKLENFLSSTLRPLLSSQDNTKPSLWIFGYGSLMWNPGFDFEDQARAKLPGYSRRFYLTNTTYRGTVEKPGRVVTIVEDREKAASTFGLAFQVRGWTQITTALEHLYVREVQNGYVFRVVNLEFEDTQETVQALTCIALRDNACYSAPSQHSSGCDCDEAYMRRMAYEIATASGKAGPNHEYLSKLADCIRALFPRVVDEHLFQLESYMLQFMNVASVGFESKAEFMELMA